MYTYLHLLKTTKFMFITLSIYSKNLNSLTNFLKFFYKLKKNQIFKVKFHIVQSQKKKSFSFFSTLQSPHVNKRSQEQFEYHVHSKKLKIHVSQITEFLTIWRLVKTSLFADVKLETSFWLYNKTFNFILFSKTNYDKFKVLKLFRLKVKYLKKSQQSSTAMIRSLNLLDIRAEILLKNLSISLGSSVGRAKDWKSLCRQFESASKHVKTFLWKTLYEIYLLTWKTARFLEEMLCMNLKQH